MSIFNDCITESLQQGRYIDIYRDNQSDETIFGKILKATDAFICMSSINDDGFYDGIKIIKNEHITRIRWGGNERTSIEKLIKPHKTPSVINKIDFESMATIIKSVNKLFGYVVVYVEDADPDICFIGKITKVDDEYLMMHEYGSMKRLDRSNLVVSLDEITSVNVDGIYERNIVQLHKKRLK